MSSFALYFIFEKNLCIILSVVITSSFFLFFVILMQVSILCNAKNARHYNNKIKKNFTRFSIQKWDERSSSIILNFIISLHWKWYVYFQISLQRCRDLKKLYKGIVDKTCNLSTWVSVCHMFNCTNRQKMTTISYQFNPFI